jgi:Tfp pilus assembly protein PilW
MAPNILPPLINRARESGFTLVELLVGLVLTLFIGTIALTFMVSSTQSFKAQSTDSISQENARFVLELLSQNIKLAGLNPENSINVSLGGIYSGSTCLANSEASIVNGQTNPCTVDEVAGGSDRFGVDFVATEDFVGCNGTNIAISSGDSKVFANIFWTADIDDDGVRSLYCQTYNVTDQQIEGAAAPLIDGVDVIQVQYGVDVPPSAFGALDTVIDRYQSFSNLTTDADNLVSAEGDATVTTTVITRRVKAVRIALLVGSGVVSGTAATLEATEEVKNRSYNLLDGPTVNFNDGVFRQMYSTTVSIPNAF